MVNKKRLIFVLLLFIGLFIISCNETPSSPTPSDIPEVKLTSDMENDAYPQPVEERVESYPESSSVSNDPPTSSSYPAPAKEYDESKRFEISGPVSAGIQSVSGIGSAKISIQIVSASNVGEPLGSGVVNDDGTFNISLSRPLDANETIAIMLADGSQRSQFLDAPGATDIPLLGFILDMKSVQ